MDGYFKYLKDVLGVRYVPMSEDISQQGETSELAEPATRVRGGQSPSPPSLESIEKNISGCTRCKLSQKRTHIVFGTGSPTASLMFVGEGPGEQEDLQG